MPNFVHLHCHSDFSLLDGASSIPQMVARAKELGMPALALTDHGNLFGALKFYKECKAAGIKPLVGSEFYVAQGARSERTGTEFGNKYYHLVLIAKNEAGWRNLMMLSSASYTEGFYYKPRIDQELIERHREGLVCLSACIAGEIPQNIIAGRMEEAERKALRYREIFGADSFFLELQDHGIPEQKVANRGLVEIARRTGIPLVATNDNHYTFKADAEAQDILLCIGTNRKKRDQGRMRFYNSEFYMKSAEEMALALGEHPEALENSLRVAELCDLSIPLPGPMLPDYEIPAGFAGPEDYLRHLTYEGLAKRYGAVDGAVRERADYELGVITGMKFTGYFLIVWDFIHYAKVNGISVGPGRGSGAGSIVAYALAITDIDPLRFHLLFERFLNPERISMPDFDVDFCFERRQEVIDYVTRRYGEDRVGQIITFGTLKAKAVIKDVARALDIPFDEANQIAKLIPDDPKMTLAKAFEDEPKLREMAQGDKYRELFEVGAKLENKNRHSSLHAAGIVIGKTKLTDFVPLYRDAKTGTVSTQFTMEQLEECGLVKMDFLGLKTLTLVQHTLELVAKQGVALTPESIPDDDPATFRMLSEGKSTCIFQFESSGMQAILKRAQPNRIEDLIALNALYRPGPMAYIDQFVDSKFGRQAIVYPDKSLEAVLKETYGVIVYQEQVMQVAQIIAGYSLGQADLLRRAMSKKKVEVMVKEKAKFVEGAKAKGFPEAKAGEIFDILIPFAGYGFNKSHAAAYSVLAYQTAYLKANYPAEFMAANLTNEIANQDKLQDYIIEARKMGIPIDPPDINRSETVFGVVEGRIVYGLLGIKNVGSGAVEAILGERAKGGPYRGFLDFAERIDDRALNRKVLETLVQTGCFDKLGQHRAALLANIEGVVGYVAHKRESRQYGQHSLFDSSGEEDFPPYAFAEAPELPQLEMLRAEKEFLGFYFSGHPMDGFRMVWERCSELDLAHPENSTAERMYTLVGMITASRQIQTKNGKPMLFATLNDYLGSIELIVFPDVFERVRDKLVADAVVAVKGKVDRQKGDPKILVEDIIDPSTLREKAFRELHLRFKGGALDEDQLSRLRDSLFERSGALELMFHLPTGEGERLVKASLQIKVSGDEASLELIRASPLVESAWKE